MTQATTKLVQQPKNEVKQLKVITEPETTLNTRTRIINRAD
jgi:hypothetical protein